MVFKLADICNNSASTLAINGLDRKYPQSKVKIGEQPRFGRQTWTIEHACPPNVAQKDLGQGEVWERRSKRIQEWLSYWGDVKNIKIVVLIESHSHSTTGDIQYASVDDERPKEISGSWLDVSSIKIR